MEEDKTQRERSYAQDPREGRRNQLFLAKPWSLGKDWAKDSKRGSSGNGEAVGVWLTRSRSRPSCAEETTVNSAYCFLFNSLLSRPEMEEGFGMKAGGKQRGDQGKPDTG